MITSGFHRSICFEALRQNVGKELRNEREPGGNTTISAAGVSSHACSASATMEISKEVLSVDTKRRKRESLPGSPTNVKQTRFRNSMALEFTA